eukprot:Opistho-1_new@41791
MAGSLALNWGGRYMGTARRRGSRSVFLPRRPPNRQGNDTMVPTGSVAARHVLPLPPRLPEPCAAPAAGRAGRAAAAGFGGPALGAAGRGPGAAGGTGRVAGFRLARQRARTEAALDRARGHRARGGVPVAHHRKLARGTVVDLGRRGAGLGRCLLVAGGCRGRAAPAWHGAGGRCRRAGPAAADPGERASERARRARIRRPDAGVPRPRGPGRHRRFAAAGPAGADACRRGGGAGPVGVVAALVRAGRVAGRAAAARPGLAGDRHVPPHGRSGRCAHGSRAGRSLLHAPVEMTLRTGRWRSVR